jgi:CBS domain-containing protein
VTTLRESTDGRDGSDRCAATRDETVPAFVAVVGGNYGCLAGVRPDGVPARGAYGRVMSALRTSSSALSIATAADAMRRGVVTCDPDSRLAAVAATVASNAFHAAVILAPDNPRALVVTDLDLIRAALSGGGEQTAAQMASEPMATIAPSARLEEAVALMAARDLAHLLVADPAADWPAGVLSSFDIASMLAGRDPALTRMVRPGPARPLVSATALSATTVGDVMHPGVVACVPETPVVEAARMMADLRMHCIAVVGVARRDDGDEHLLWGLVSDMDVLHAAHRGELMTPASEVAATAPLALPESAGLDRAAALMAEHDATHVVAVGRSGMPSGVVSTLDVLRIVAAG